MSQTNGLTYQIISDQRAKVFIKVSISLLSTWIRALLCMTNCVNGSSHQHTLLSPPQILETRTSSVRKDRSFGIGIDTVPLGTNDTCIDSINKA